MAEEARRDKAPLVSDEWKKGKRRYPSKRFGLVTTHVSLWGWRYTWKRWYSTEKARAKAEQAFSKLQDIATCERIER